MRSSRFLAFFVVVAIILVFFLFDRIGDGQANDTPLANGDNLNLVPVVPNTQQPDSAPNAAAATNLPTPTAAQNTGDPTATPQAFFAEQLQTIIPGNTAPPVTSSIEGWNPPPLEVPLAHHPFDHYWFIRPVGSNYNNFGLGYYPYGSDGPRNDLRIHHGIDLSNPIGVEVYAAGDGTVVWADKGLSNEYESITAYGNTVVIQHDFGYNGQAIYTLYAHLSALIVSAGQHVDSGAVIGLIGNTGQVTGPHVHFEVRVGRNSYFAVRNPVLWAAPYVGTGVIAGNITFNDGSSVPDVTITLIDRASGRVVDRTSSYAGFGINPDDNWDENFVFSDVPVGRYLVTSRYDQFTWSGEVDVIPGTTNWVTLQRFIPEPDGTSGDDS